MLSPHEIAALVLVSGGLKPPDLDTADIEALLAHQLITLEPLGPGLSEPRVTLEGHTLLRALGILRARASRQEVAALR